MSQIQNSKILITGGAGFIGSNLVYALIKNNEIVVVDDLSMGKIENLPQSEHLHFFKHSITDKNFMDKLLINWKFDYIFLLAAVASVTNTIERPLETHKINQDANINILETIRVRKIAIKKLLFASSAAVYGNNPNLPKREMSTIGPLSPYAIDKYASEQFTINYGKLYNIPTVATRFFNVYGPKQNPNSPYSGVLSLIRKDIEQQKEFVLFGDGNQTRDFVYIEDVVRALILLATNELAVHDVFNVATGVETSINDVIKLLEKISGKKLKMRKERFRLGDIQRSVSDINKIKKIGFITTFDIERGLLKYWNTQTAK